MEKIEREQAEKEVVEWLEGKGYNEKKREPYKPVIDEIAELVSEGVFRFEDDGFHGITIVQKLIFPIKEIESGDIIHKEIRYKQNVWVKELNTRLQNIKNMGGCVSSFRR